MTIADKTTLEALRDAGTWTPPDVFNYGRTHGGSYKTYAALARLVRAGKVAYEPNRWTYVQRYDPANTQLRGAS